MTLLRSHVVFFFTCLPSDLQMGKSFWHKKKWAKHIGFWNSCICLVCFDVCHLWIVKRMFINRRIGNRKKKQPGSKQKVFICLFCNRPFFGFSKNNDLGWLVRPRRLSNTSTLSSVLAGKCCNEAAASAKPCKSKSTPPPYFLVVKYLKASKKHPLESWRVLSI